MDDARDVGPDLDDDDERDPNHVDVVALVLGQVPAELRAGVVEHLVACSRCRREYDELSTTVSELLPGVPAVQPPLGFDQQVLDRMAVSSPRLTSRIDWQRLARVAAALIVVVGIAGLVGWWRMAADDTRSDGARSDGARSLGMVSALESTRDGSEVGTVSLRDVGEDAVMVVAVVAAPEGVSYRCRTTYADGTISETDPWAPGNGAWLVPVPSSASVDTVELVVAGTDHVWSTASFEAN